MTHQRAGGEADTAPSDPPSERLRLAGQAATQPASGSAITTGMSRSVFFWYPS
jgi:hypothetical protein